MDPSFPHSESSVRHTTSYNDLYFHWAQIAAVSLMIYDLVISLSDEISLIWKSARKRAISLSLDPLWASTSSRRRCRFNTDSNHRQHVTLACLAQTHENSSNLIDTKEYTGHCGMGFRYDTTKFQFISLTKLSYQVLSITLLLYAVTCAVYIRRNMSNAVHGAAYSWFLALLSVLASGLLLNRRRIGVSRRGPLSDEDAFTDIGLHSHPPGLSQLAIEEPLYL
ncbi:hypothetical protein CVT26_002452 [Gymnopilus dilepis]|uniref:DUF6533 domain-containing protein n=1 Tax=Gymnopilus dilepis TaxID=231916 RepID=A0A409VT21_9AGAR|nr:hypothetical protein CVT26_002452 [Gymnopilus dilepis]